MIYAMKQRPELLKCAFGIQVHRAAIKKIKGTPWESVLYPDAVDIQTLREMEAFRREADKTNEWFNGEVDKPRLERLKPADPLARAKLLRHILDNADGYSLTREQVQFIQRELIREHAGDDDPKGAA